MATTQETFDFVIQAIDKATSPLKAIANAVLGVGKAAEHANHDMGHVTKAAQNAGAAAGHVGHAAGGIEDVCKAAKCVKGGLDGAGKAAHAAAGHLGKVTAHNRGFMALIGHVHLLRHHFGELNVGIGEVGHSVTEFLPMLGALGAAGSLAGLFELTEHVSEMRSEFIATATKIGILPGQLGALNMAAKLTDVNVESMQAGLVKLDKAIATAAGGKNKEAAGLFAHLGISLGNGHGGLKKVADVMPQLADAFKRTADPAMRIRMAMALFGKAGADLVPMLAEGSEGLREFAEIAARVNYAPSKDEAEGLEKFHKSWIILQAAVNGFANAIGSKLAPVLYPVLDMVTDLVVANRNWIATAIAAKVAELAHWFSVVKDHLPEILMNMKSWIMSIVDTESHLGGLKTIIGAVVLVIGSPLISAVGGVIGAMGSLGRMIVWVGSVMYANPIIAIIAVIAAAAFLIYEYWEPIKAFWSGWWQSAVADLKHAWEDIKALVNQPIVQMMINAWQALPEFFRKMWDDIKAIFSDAMGYIQPIIDKITSAANVISHSFIGRHLGLGAGDATPGAPSAPAIPSPYGDNGAAAPTSGGGPGQDGKVHVQVDINNLPPGSTVKTQSSGAAQTPDLNVGYAMPVFAY